MLVSPGLESVAWLSVDANPDPVTKTVTPVGPEEGLNARTIIVPVNVALPESPLPAAVPLAVTGLLVPPFENVNPFVPTAENWHEPPPEATGLTVTEQRVDEAGPWIVIDESLEANPATVTVTVIPAGPRGGLRVRLDTVPVNAAL